MGVPVYTQPGYEGGIFLAPDYQFSKSYFTDQEIEDIVLAFHIFGHISRRTEKHSALKKLEILVLKLAFLKESDFDEYFKIELLQKPVTASTPICKIINEGLDAEVFLRMTVEGETYTVAPLNYVSRKDGLYLHCTDGGQEFAFETDKIQKCVKTARSFDWQAYQREQSSVR